jgi:hypothetical protein
MYKALEGLQSEREILKKPDQKSAQTVRQRTGKPSGPVYI